MKAVKIIIYALVFITFLSFLMLIIKMTRFVKDIENIGTPLPEKEENAKTATNKPKCTMPIGISKTAYLEQECNKFDNEKEKQHCKNTINYNCNF